MQVRCLWDLIYEKIPFFDNRWLRNDVVVMHTDVVIQKLGILWINFQHTTINKMRWHTANVLYCRSYKS